MDIGAAIREARIKRGMSQRNLSEACGINHGNLSRYESGETEPSIESLGKIAAALKLDASTLLWNAETRSAAGQAPSTASSEKPEAA